MIQPVHCISPAYQQLASIHCDIHDYSAWVEQERILSDYLEIAQYFDIDMDRLMTDVKHHRLQRECLRAHERISLVPG